MADGNSTIYDQARKRVALSTVGFISLPRDNSAMESLGSATLARIGNHRGVITAAHVADALEKHEMVGLSHFVPPEGLT